jgi:hypothetical protein
LIRRVLQIFTNSTSRQPELDPTETAIRRGLKNAMDQTLRDPQAIAPIGLDPAAVSGSGGPSSMALLACIGLASGQYSSSSDGASGSPQATE